MARTFGRNVHPMKGRSALLMVKLHSLSATVNQKLEGEQGSSRTIMRSGLKAGSNICRGAL